MSATKLYAYEPLRDIVGRAIYEDDEGGAHPERPDWYSLHDERREPWRRDADRVLRVLFEVDPDHPDLKALGVDFCPKVEGVDLPRWLNGPKPRLGQNR